MYLGANFGYTPKEVFMRKEEEDNIVKFYKRKNDLTDNDITNLFAGFVALLKRKALLDCENRFNVQILTLKNRIKELENQVEQFGVLEKVSENKTKTDN